MFVSKLYKKRKIRYVYNNIFKCLCRNHLNRNNRIFNGFTIMKSNFKFYYTNEDNAGAGDAETAGIPADDEPLQPRFGSAGVGGGAPGKYM